MDSSVKNGEQNDDNRMLITDDRFTTHSDGFFGWADLNTMIPEIGSDKWKPNFTVKVRQEVEELRATNNLICRDFEVLKKMT